MNIPIIELLLAKGADINIKSNEGYTPFFYGINQANIEVMKFLIVRGADVNIKGNDGKTPLYYAL
jgi:uncharacterized protein